MSPKPILKCSVSTTHEQPHKTTQHRHPDRTHGVHFPPSPSLTRTFAVYSATTYDRSPIVVSPNNCALPERGCPGRTYTLEECAAQKPHRGISYARDFHPRALAFASARSSSPCSTRIPIDAAVNERPFYPALPQLIPDLSSESDESDGFSGIPSASTTSPPTFGIHGLAGPPSKYNADAYSNVDMNGYTQYVDDSNALAFLPYPPSPPSHKYPESVDPFMQNTRRRRVKPESKRESSRDPDRIRSSGGSDSQHCALAFSSLSISSSPISSVTPKKRSTKKRLATSLHSYPSVSPTHSNFGSLDDGCLGGF
ncbi:hypothetical protein BYT27DRAFT_7204392 [Phlegmacium glaucopus]|nr:hypothetical protein BYT27DRAFT_7204392 [Phlegmacium glaucopus]